MDNISTNKQEIKLEGIGASPGIAVGSILILGNKINSVEKAHIAEEDVDLEINVLEDAIELSKEQLEELQQKVQKELDDEEARIFDAQLLMLEDYNLINSIKEKIKKEFVSAEFAFYEKIQNYIKILSNIKDSYIKERTADIRDIATRVLYNIHNAGFDEINDVLGEKIIVSSDLSPSDVASIERGSIQAFITETGSRTSHAAIIARSMNIPAVVALKYDVNQMHSGDVVIVDGFNGAVIINPSIETLAFYAKKETEREILLNNSPNHEKSIITTKDGRSVKILANIEFIEDLDGVKYNNANGIGLYRTEYLFLNRADMPSEEEQYEAYKFVLLNMPGKEVTIRTLDLGGDKLNLYREKNPFLGYRAIRFCLGNIEIFKNQLRAILRASIYGRTQIMFPMISCVEEIDEVLKLIEESKQELVKNGIPFDNKIKIGMMIETPSAALLADRFAKKVDFFSIGTNDLVQYTMAIDRTSEKVAYLYQPAHPSVLFLIKHIVDAADKSGVDVCVCGEMGGDPIFTPLLLGLGIKELSMSSISINSVRKIISSSNFTETVELANNAMRSSTAEESLKYSTDYIKKVSPEIYKLITRE